MQSVEHPERRRTLKLFAAVGVAASTPAWGEDRVGDGTTIMTRAYEASRFRSARFTAELTLAGARGEHRTRTLTGVSKLIEQGVGMARLMRFSAPADIAGAATLTIERGEGADDLWLYLPALHRVRRLVSSNKRDAWVGSEFSLGDIAGYRVADWRHQLGGEAAVDGMATQIVTSTPATPTIAADWGYSRRVSWVRREDGLTLRMDAYDLAGTLFKRLTAAAVQSFPAAPGKAQPLRLVMQNLQNGAVSTLNLANFVVNGAVADAAVAPTALDA